MNDEVMTLNELPHELAVHALFSGYDYVTHNYVFEVTGRGTLLLPAETIERGDCGKFLIGEDLLLIRNGYELIIKRPEREVN